MTTISKTVEELCRQAAVRIEDELCALVGTGMDLAVAKMLEAAESGMVLEFRRIPGGSTPDYPCTVFRVSELGPWRKA